MAGTQQARKAWGHILTSRPGRLGQTKQEWRRRLLPGVLLGCLLVLPCLVGGQRRLPAAETLTQQAEALSQKGKYSQALPLAQKAAVLIKQAKGEASGEYADSLNTLADLHKGMRRYGEAELLYKQALRIRKKAQGENDPDYAADLDNLALLYKEMGRYGEAEPLFKQVGEIDSKALGKNHPDYATDLNNLAALYEVMGRYGEAEPLYKQALEIDRTALGETHQVYATSLNNLALLYKEMGRYAEAQPLYKQALRIMKKVQGENFPDFATYLNNLASLYEDMGRYGEAEPLYKQALEIDRKALGETHQVYATSLNNLALLYKEMGRYAEAQPLYKQALRIMKKAVGEHHPDYATSLNNLASLYEDMGRYGEAVPLFKQAGEIDRKALGENHPHYATDLNSLAVFYYEMGHYSEAEPLYKEAIRIKKKALGDNHPDSATYVNNLAVLYDNMGRYGEAELLYTQALGIRKRTLGENHPDYATSLRNLAGLYAATNRSEQALPNVRKALAIEQVNLHQVFGFSAEPAMRSYLDTLPRAMNALLTLTSTAAIPLAAVNPNSPAISSATAAFAAAPPSHAVAALLPEGAREAALTWTLRRKGMLLDTLCHFQSARHLTEADPTFASNAARYRLLRQQRANRALQVNQAPPAQQQKLQLKLRDLDKEINTLEGSLNRALSTQMGDQSNAEPTIEAVRSRLPVGSALVEYVRYTPVHFGAKDKSTKAAPARYVAFVLASTPNTAPHQIDLGEAASIDAAVLALRRPLEESNPFVGEKRAYTQFAQASHILYERIFAPLHSALGPTSRLLIAPDGELNRVPFDALLDVQNRYVLQTHQLSYLTCGRDLLRPTYARGQGAVVFAAPNFDLGGVQRQARAKLLLPNPTHVATLSPPAGGIFTPLPKEAQTDGSVIGISLKLGGFGSVQVYVGDDALEEVFKAVSAPLILHVLTHGFFQPDVKRAQQEEHIVVARVQGLVNPLLRCGIVLAGANARSNTAETSANVDDGWVTAEEMAQMNLRGTELVVLSSCESGLGDVQSGEGVYGLRRALLYAGAHSLVTSLYEVPTEPTRVLMKTFYAGLAKGQSRQEALHNAQLQQLKADLAHGPAVRPRSWAGFILIGEPSALPSANKPTVTTLKITTGAILENPSTHSEGYHYSQRQILSKHIN